MIPTYKVTINFDIRSELDELTLNKFIRHSIKSGLDNGILLYSSMDNYTIKNIKIDEENELLKKFIKITSHYDNIVTSGQLSYDEIKDKDLDLNTKIYNLSIGQSLFIQKDLENKIYYIIIRIS